MIVKTLQYGDVEVASEQIVTFHDGIPGFKDLRRFAVIVLDSESLFSFMQSVEDENISFLIVNPFLFYPNYEFELDEEQKGELELADPADVATFCIVTVREPLEESTMNLLAPVVINTKTQRAKQIILHNTAYQPRHKLMGRLDDGIATEEGE